MMEELANYQALSNQQAENQKKSFLNQQLKRAEDETIPVVFTEVEKESVQEWLVSLNN